MESTTESHKEEYATKHDAKTQEVEVPADVYGHVLDDRGGVYMELQWKDDGIKSRGEVKKIMNSPFEKRQLGRISLEYCNRLEINDELFRLKGKARVKGIKGHEWASCGRPMVEIEWLHGELTKVLVKNAMEYKGDANGFMAAWTTYCDGIGADDMAFRKGHVDKTHRLPIQKKRKIDTAKW